MAMQFLLPLPQNTWKTHVDYIATEISKGVGVLLYHSKELSYNIFIFIYNTMI